MTPDELSFITAICAEPADDTARLVYADWLDEHGGRPERAEFIRVQCQLARMPTECDRTFCDGQLVVCEDCRKWKALRKRQRELIQAENGDWLMECGTDDEPGVNIRRGFLQRAVMSAADWLRHADALCWHPEQTVKCLTKGCDHGSIGRPGPKSVGGQWMGRMCDACDGTGFLRRTCPPTAQPITHVTLTTIPEFDANETECWLVGDRQLLRWVDVWAEATAEERAVGGEILRAFLRRRWLGITFELPDPDTRLLPSGPGSIDGATPVFGPGTLTRPRLPWE